MIPAVRGDLPGNSPRDLRDVLGAGVERGIITEAQARALSDLAQAPDAPAEDEHLRLVTGFADVFVTIGLVLFLGSALYLGVGLFGGTIGYGLSAALAWFLAETFTRRRRMALPSLFLLGTLVTCAFAAVATALAGTVPWLWSGARVLPSEAAGVALAALATVAVAAAHYRRFGVPVTVAAGAAASLGALAALLLAIDPDFARTQARPLMMLGGLSVFALAMRYDLSDPARLTRRADVAFWLHLLAAPLIVHPVLIAAMPEGGQENAGAWAAMLGLVLVLALVAVLTDRRAILVSGFAYAATAGVGLIREAGLGRLSLPLGLLALGGFVLLLSVGWQRLRRVLLRHLPQPLAARLPRPVGVR